MFLNRHRHQSKSNCQDNPASNNVERAETATKKRTKIPTIYYASRTHSQITQVIREYRKTGYRVPMAVLASRKLLIKLICLATFLQVSETEVFDPYQEALKAMMGFIDVAGLYYALAQLTHINISQNHKFQAVGLGCAFADSVLHRLAPLWVGALGLEFTWDYVLQGPSISTDPAELVKCKSLGSNASKIWVNVSKVDDAKVWRPNSKVNFISDAIGTIVGWTNDKIVYV